MPAHFLSIGLASHVAIRSADVTGNTRKSLGRSVTRVVWRTVVCLVALTITCAAVAQREPSDNPALSAAIEKLMTLQLGQDLRTFAPIDQAVAQSQGDEQLRRDVEARLITVLRGQSTDEAKDYACRQLALVGSDVSIPALTSLLTDARASHMARYALEGIGGPDVARSLRDSLNSTSGMQKVGVVISLGRLADSDAVASLAGLLNEKDPELLEPTVVALGRIGTPAASDALQKFAARAPESLHDAVVDAELDAAESLCKRERFDAAAELYRTLEADPQQGIRTAAFRGLIAAQPEESLKLILAGLAAEQPWKRDVAADCVCDLERVEDITAITSAISRLPVAGQVAAWGSLKGRDQASVRTAALQALQQPQLEVRVAALAALTSSATATDVPQLVRIMTTVDDAAEREAAYETLRLMPASGTDQALLEEINRTADPDPQLVRCAFARRSPVAVPGFLHAAESPNAATRLAAFSALEVMATPRELDSLIRLLGKTSPGEEREAADRAVWKSCQQIPDPTARAAPLLAALAQADRAGQCAILPALARLGGEKSLAAVHAAMQSQDQEVRNAGYRALANWPDASVADELLDIAQNGDVASYRVWALRAYARVISLPSERPPHETYTMLKNALEMATRSEDRQLIITRMGAIRTPEALSLLLSLLDQAELKEAATAAVFELAKGLSQSHPDEAQAALQRIRSMTDDPAIRQQIPKVLRDIEARKQDQNK